MWRNCGAMAAVGGVVAVVSMCYSGGCKAYLRCKCGAKMAKLWYVSGVSNPDFLHFGCQGGEMVVRLRRLVVWLLGFRVWFLYDLVADAAFGNL